MPVHVVAGLPPPDEPLGNDPLRWSAFEFVPAARMPPPMSRSEFWHVPVVALAKLRPAVGPDTVAAAIDVEISVFAALAIATWDDIGSALATSRIAISHVDRTKRP